MPPAPEVSRSEFPHFRAVPTRWKDNDVYGHVNNVEYYSFFDTVINAWLIEEGGLDIHGGESIGVCVQSSCEFRASVGFPETIEAGLRVAKLGRSSVQYEIALFRADSEEAVATGNFTHVFVDRTERRPVEIPGQIREALERLIPPGAG